MVYVYSCVMNAGSTEQFDGTVVNDFLLKTSACLNLSSNLLALKGIEVLQSLLKLPMNYEKLSEKIG